MFQKLNTTAFFDRLAIALREPISPTQMRSVYLLLKEADANGITDKNQMAYVLATCWHECRFKSIKEIRAKPGTKVWRMQNAYWSTGYFGWGFSQLTWLKNYKKFRPVVGLDLVAFPDKALLPEVGAKILVYGMVNGSFTGAGLKSSNNLSKYFQIGETPDWINARKIVNGNFQADKVASAAVKILSVIVASELPIT